MDPEVDAKMPSDAQSIYASTPFKFIIDGNPLYIHPTLISRNSKPLDRMINGPMAEAQKGFAVINDVDEGTFVRFIQWAYNGYYDAAKYELDPVSRSSSINSAVINVVEEADVIETATPPRNRMFGKAEPPPESEETAEGPVSDGWGSFGSAKAYSSKDQKKAKKAKRDYAYSGEFEVEEPTTQSSKHDLKESFIKRKETVRKHPISLPQPRENRAPNEDYTKVFLSHTHLYVFADKYDIQTLKTLALEELQAMLKIFNLYLERTGDIIALLRYVYANTGEPEEGVEDMRALLTHYIGCEMDTLMKDKGFRKLMIDDGGALLGDFMTMVGKRIC